MKNVNRNVMELRADSREHCENDILILAEHYGARVIVKPHRNGNEWWATVELPRQNNYFMEVTKWKSQSTKKML